MLLSEDDDTAVDSWTTHEEFDSGTLAAITLDRTLCVKESDPQEVRAANADARLASAKKMRIHAVNGRLETEYKKSALPGGGNSHWGRLVVQDCGVQRLTRRARSALLHPDWDDIDIQNCHVHMLVEIGERNQLPHRHLSRAKDFREHVYQELKDAGVGERDQCKELVLKVINGNMVLYNQFKHVPVLRGIHDEMQEYHLWVRAQYRKIYREQVERGRPRPAVSTLSVLLGEYETRATVAMVRDMARIHGPFPHVFMFDGVMFQKRLRAGDHIASMEAAILAATGMNLRLVLKPIPNVPVAHPVEMRDRYVGSIILDVAQNPTLILRAPMGQIFPHFFLRFGWWTGAGKTYSIVELINEYTTQDLTVLVVTFRCSLVSVYMSKIPYATKYSRTHTTNLEDKANRVVITTLDSLDKIVGKADLLIIDEHTYTMDRLLEIERRQQKITMAIMERISVTERIVIADALLTGPDIDALALLRPERAKIIDCEHRPYAGQVVFDCSRLQHLREFEFYAEAGETLAVISNSKKELAVYAAILDDLGQAYDMVTATEPLGQRDPNDFGKDGRHLLISPAMTAGVSIENLNFHRRFIYATCHSSAAEHMVQMFGRFRQTKEGIDYIRCPCDGEDVETDGDVITKQLQDSIKFRDRATVLELTESQKAEEHYLRRLYYELLLQPDGDDDRMNKWLSLVARTALVRQRMSRKDIRTVVSASGGVTRATGGCQLRELLESLGCEWLTHPMDNCLEHIVEGLPAGQEAIIRALADGTRHGMKLAAAKAQEMRGGDEIKKRANAAKAKADKKEYDAMVEDPLTLDEYIATLVKIHAQDPVTPQEALRRYAFEVQEVCGVGLAELEPKEYRQLLRQVNGIVKAAEFGGWPSNQLPAAIRQALNVTSGLLELRQNPHVDKFTQRRTKELTRMLGSLESLETAGAGVDHGVKQLGNGVIAATKGLSTEMRDCWGVVLSGAKDSFQVVDATMLERALTTWVPGQAISQDSQEGSVRAEPAGNAGQLGAFLLPASHILAQSFNPMPLSACDKCGHTGSVLQLRVHLCKEKNKNKQPGGNRNLRTKCRVCGKDETGNLARHEQACRRKQSRRLRDERVECACGGSFPWRRRGEHAQRKMHKAWVTANPGQDAW